MVTDKASESNEFRHKNAHRADFSLAVVCMNVPLCVWLKHVVCTTRAPMARVHGHFGHNANGHGCCHVSL